MGKRHLSSLLGAVAVAFFLAALAQAAEPAKMTPALSPQITQENHYA